MFCVAVWIAQKRISVKLSVMYRFKNGSTQTMEYLAVWYKAPLVRPFIVFKFLKFANVLFNPG